MTPGDVFTAIAFYLVGATTLVAGIGMVLVRNMVRSALLLVLALGGVALMYVLLSADFLAVVQLLLYIGAIMILMLFAIMLTPGQVDLPSSAPQAQRITSALTALAVGVISLFVVLSHPWRIRAAPLDIVTSERLGSLLMSTYVLPFEIASLLLTIGMIGAIVIARED
ncbi:MAG TPA: NADH-quinone oxidoreductase subunit J [Chloroflexota bacterium]|nr:NADH-quinone oxidoreductase subunit J [Chloroflexota bacterium]